MTFFHLDKRSRRLLAVVTTNEVPTEPGGAQNARISFLAR
jgi:hypothetical protein